MNKDKPKIYLSRLYVTFRIFLTNLLFLAFIYGKKIVRFLTFYGNKLDSFLFKWLRLILVELWKLIKNIKLIDRYVGWQILFSTVFAVLVLSVVLVVGRAFKELLVILENSNINIWFIIEFLAQSLPFSFSFTIPWGFLTAILLVFGRLSADNELISMRMAGMSMLRICSSSFFLGLFLTIICYWLNVRIVPKAFLRGTNMIIEQIQNDPMAIFETGESISIPGHVVFLEAKDEQIMKNIFLAQLGDKTIKKSNKKRVIKNIPKFFLLAKTAQIINKPKEKVMNMVFNGVHFINTGSGYPKDLSQTSYGIEAQKHTIPIDTKEFTKDKQKFKTKFLTNSEIRKLQKNKEYFASLPEDKRIKTKNNLRFEKAQRLAFSLASLTFMLLGVPLGITAQRRETSAGFVLSLGIALIYFLFTIIASWFKDGSGFLPIFFLWLPNIIFITLGGFLFYRLSKK